MTPLCPTSDTVCYPTSCPALSLYILLLSIWLLYIFIVCVIYICLLQPEYQPHKGELGKNVWGWHLSSCRDLGSWNPPEPFKEAALGMESLSTAGHVPTSWTEQGKAFWLTSPPGLHLMNGSQNEIEFWSVFFFLSFFTLVSPAPKCAFAHNWKPWCICGMNKYVYILLNLRVLLS